jgi:hypothetical protein
MLATPIRVHLRLVLFQIHSCPFAFRFASIRGLVLRLFAAIPFSRVAGEAVGAPILGADTMMYEEKTGWIVSFFDGF